MANLPVHFLAFARTTNRPEPGAFVSRLPAKNPPSFRSTLPSACDTARVGQLTHCLWQCDTTLSWGVQMMSVRPSVQHGDLRFEQQLFSQISVMQCLSVLPPHIPGDGN